jgi:hypothetical protein
MSSPLGNWLKRIPSRVWKKVIILLLIIIAIAGAFIWHGHKVKSMKQVAYNAGYAAAIDAGKATNAVVNKGSTQISGKHRSELNEKLADNAHRADTLRLRGPGKATACIYPGLPGSPGGQDTGPGNVGPEMAGVPDTARDGIIALPFGQTVDRLEVSDANRLEAEQWRKWHSEMTDYWARIKAETEKASQK